MRRMLAVIKVDIEAKKQAEYLGCTEIVNNVPRLAGLVKSFPAVVLESATNPGVVLGVFDAARITREELDALQDLPTAEQPLIRDPITEVDELKVRIAALEAKLGTGTR